jgi:hypothetical protein
MSSTQIKEIGENLESHYRVMKNGYGQDVAVPVVDVRDGLAYRMMADAMCKFGNRSKYMNYNQYNQSPRKTNKHVDLLS